MATPISTASFAKALWPGVNAWYGKAYDEHVVEYTDLFDKYTSDRNYEEDVGITSFGLASVKPEGSSIQYDTEGQGFTTRYTHVVYGIGFIVTKEAFEDDLYNVVGEKRAKALAFSMRQTKETVAANVYNRAFNSSYTGGDGVTMCNTAHPNVAGGTWSNRLAVDAALSEAAIEQMCIDIMGATNDRGLRISLRPKTLHVPTALFYEATRILKTEYRVGTANNDISAIVATSALPMGMKMNHYLTSTTAWFVRTNAPEGLKYFERRGDSFDMDNDFDTENAKFKATARYSFGWTDPRAIWGTSGA
jgi:hypothetical protein